MFVLSNVVSFASAKTMQQASSKYLLCESMCVCVCGWWWWIILEKNGEDNPVCHLPGMIHLILFITVILKASLFSASTIYDLLEFVLNFAASYFWKNIITNKLLRLNYC